MQSTTTSATFAFNGMLCKAMARRRKETKPSTLYDPLLSSRKRWFGKQTPRGYVPVLVGDGEEEEAAERFLVHVDLFNDARFTALLEMAAEEFGYTQRGVIRIPFNARHFEKMVDVVSKAR
ncbi:auxin-responsive protein SAUR71 [Musa acuminata AAA Group]|uniref:auxin-responsive protein SAUR71 n=2 Tax=Musa acuminata AAA Group TaxID=214697 RepID=UPI0031D214BF